METVDIDETTEFILADAADIPVKSSSMDCIVSSYFAWDCKKGEERFILFVEMLSEWRRIIRRSTGHIIIMSSKECIEDILQVSELVGLKPIKILDKKHYDQYTIFFRRM
jgi:ubiquinone/menaquinone biosynthesis C-methylase UbiE